MTAWNAPSTNGNCSAVAPTCAVPARTEEKTSRMDADGSDATTDAPVADADADEVAE